MSDPFWSDNIDILFEHHMDFFPVVTHTMIERLNALVRLSFYVSVVLSLFYKKLDYFAFLIGTMLLTYFVYKNRTSDKYLQPSTFEKFEEPSRQNCTMPTLGNPFMNFTMGDFMNIDQQKRQVVEKKPICNPRDPEVQRQTDMYFQNNLYRDVNDVFGKMNSQRQFYTMPWTGIVPDEKGEFKNWLYKTDKTCKESGNCLRYEDIRAKAPIFPNPKTNPVVSKQ
ncbi:hypothetical protein EB077_10365 [bacterium]|nr:hypothetical protein [bacterium]